MARPLTCDEHPDTVGILLIQNLVEFKTLVACPQCVPDMVLTLAQSTGVAQAIAETAQQELYEQVAEQNKAKAKTTTRKATAKTAAPKDTPAGGESTDAGQ